MSQPGEGAAALIEQAIEMVVMRMQGKRRKGGDRPMIVHSLRVGFALDRAGEPLPTVVAGFLHDVVEDAGVTYEEVRKVFGSEITDLVTACTYDEELHKRDLGAAQDDLMQRAKQCGRPAIAIKVADASDNMLSVENLPADRQLKFLERAERWHKLGQHFLGPANVLTAQLGRRLERAQVVVR